MTDFQKDVFIGLVFIAGIYGFISGAFIFSTLLFGIATTLSTMISSRKSIERTPS